MVSQLEEAKRMGAIDVTSSPGQQQPTGFRTIVRPSRTASQEDIRRAIQTGRFAFRFFDIQPTRVRSTGEFDVQRERARALAGQKLAPSVIRSLEIQQKITPQLATQLRQISRARTQEQAARLRQQVIRRTQAAAVPTAPVPKGKIGSIINQRLRQLGRPGISSGTQLILSDFARQTGLGKVNADFAAGRIGRSEFVRLVNSASERSKALQSKKLVDTRRDLFSGTITQRVDRNLKKALNLFKNIPQPTSPQETFQKDITKEQKAINTLKDSFNQEVTDVQKKIDAGTATQKDLDKINLLSRFVERRQTTLDKKVTGFNKQQEATQALIPRARREDFIGELTAKDVFDEFKNIPKDADDLGKFFQKTLKTQEKNRAQTVVINGKRVPRLDLIKAGGQVIGGALGLLQAFGTSFSFGGQIVSKTLTKTATGRTEFVLNRDIANAIQTARRVTPKGIKELGNLLITNPIKFIRIENRKYIFTPRVAGEIGRAVFDVSLLFLPGLRAARILKLNNAGKPIKVLGTFSLKNIKVPSRFFNNLKIKNLKDVGSTGAKVTGANRGIISDIANIPEVKAGKIRIGTELGKAITGVKDVKAAIKQASKKITEPIIDNVISKTTPIRKAISNVEVGGELTLIQARQLSNNLTLLSRELASQRNANRLAISQRDLQALFQNELLALSRGSLFLRRPGNLLKSKLIVLDKRLEKLNRSIADKLAISRKLLLRKTRPFRRVVRKEELLAKSKLKKVAENLDLKRLLLKKARDDARFVIAESKSQFGALKSLFKLPQRSVKDLFGSEIKTAKRLLLRIEPALKKLEDVTLLQARTLRNKALKVKKMFNDELINIKLKGKAKVLKRTRGTLKKTKKKIQNIRDRFDLLILGLKTTFNLLSATSKKVVRSAHNRQLSRMLRTRSNLVRRILGRSISRNETQSLLALINRDLKLLQKRRVLARKARIRATNARNQRRFDQQKLATRQEQKVFFGAIKDLESFERKVQKTKFRQFKEPKVGPGEKIVKTRTGTLQIVKTKVKPRVKRRVVTRVKRRVRVKAKVKRRVRVKPRVKTRAKRRAVAIVFPKQRIRLTSAVRARAIQAARARGLRRVQVRVTQKAATRAAQAGRIAFRVAITPKTVAIFAVRFLPKLRLRRAVRLLPRQRRLQRLRVRQRLKAKRVLPPFLIPQPTSVSVQSIARLKGPFNIIARKKGKRVKLNSFPLTGRQALGIGGNKVDNKAIRSFTIVKTTGRTRKIKVPRFSSKKFRRPIGNTKLQRFFLVEKTKFAIDTRGEKREITAKGIRARRRKRRVKRVRRKIRRGLKL